MRDQGISSEKISLNVARLKKGGHIFEVVIDPDKAIEYKEKKISDVTDVLKSEEVFTDARKGDLASEHDMEELFETSDALKVAEIILKNGEIQITGEHRQKLRDEKRKKIINIIHRNAVDPKTHLPHPMTRLENAFEEAKIKIDDNKKVDEQVQEIINKLKVVLPIKFEIKKIQVTIPAQYAAKMYAVVKSFGDMKKDEWLNDGSWTAVVEIPGGLEQEFYDKLNNMTHGNIDAKVIERS